MRVGKKSLLGSRRLCRVCVWGFILNEPVESSASALCSSIVTLGYVDLEKTGGYLHTCSLVPDISVTSYMTGIQYRGVTSKTGAEQHWRWQLS